MELAETAGMEQLRQETLERYLDRLCRLPVFVKELKERFTRWYNKTHGRQGTLWMARYKCVLVQDGLALRTMAAYIDLNPVRADLVEDPKDYRWCGYAEAVAGSKRARRGLCRVMERPLDGWKEGGDQMYRCWLMQDGIEGSRDDNDKPKKGVARAKVEAVLTRKGKLSVGELLRCRVRHFTDGMVLGSRSFVDEMFEERRGWFGKNRKDGARALPIEDNEICAMRDLRLKVLERR